MNPPDPRRPEPPPLDAERWRRVAGVVEVALELDPATRAAYLEAMASQDEQLHRRALRVLRSMDIVGSEDEPARSQDRATSGEQDDRIGPWRTVRLLGRGGMGVVFLAERDDAEYERRVAVKVIGGGFQTPLVYRRFLAERQILATFDHPHIAKLYDGGTALDGRPYLVMEYIDGLPVDRYCFENGLALADRLRLFRKVCAAVAYAHRQLVVHRDLKPTNILVGDDGEPKLLDFGIAKLLEPASLLPFDVEATRTTQAVMTPNWASPEQLRGEAISTSSDVYSLGLLLFKLLAGALPFRGLRTAGDDSSSISTRPSRMLLDPKTEEAGVDAWEEGQRPQAARALRGDLDNIIMKALRPEQELRYPSVEALDEDLERYLDGRPVSATRDTPFYVVRKFVARYRWQMTAAMLLILAILGTAGAALWQAENLRRERDQTQIAKDRAQEQARRAELQASRAEGSLQFLGDLLRAADKTEREQQDLSVQDLLVEALDRIEGGALAAPEARIDLLRLISSAFFDFRDLPSSVRSLELALATADEAGLSREQRDDLLAELAQVQIFANDQANIQPTCEALLEGSSPGARSTRQKCLVALEYVAHMRGDMNSLVRYKRRFLEETAEAETYTAGDLDGLVGWSTLYEFGLMEADESLAMLERLSRLAVRELTVEAQAPFHRQRAMDQFRILARESRTEEAARFFAFGQAGQSSSHQHDTVYADQLLVESRLYRDQGRTDEAMAAIDKAEDIATSMLEIDPMDLRARYILASVPATRAAVWGSLGDDARERTELEKALVLTGELARQSGGHFLIVRNYVLLLLRTDRLDEARPLVEDLLKKGYRTSVFLELAREKDVLPDPMPPAVEFDHSIPPRLLAAFNATAHLKLPWEVEGGLGGARAGTAEDGD